MKQFDQWFAETFASNDATIRFTAKLAWDSALAEFEDKLTSMKNSGKYWDVEWDDVDYVLHFAKEGDTT